MQSHEKETDIVISSIYFDVCLLFWTKLLKHSSTCCNRKKSGNSIALSALLPGAGQMYNGEVKLGLITFAAVPVFIISGSILRSYIDTENKGQYKKDNEQIAHTSGNILLTTGVVLYLAQLVQAPLAAVKWNKKNGFASANYKMEFAVKQSGISLCYNF